MEIITYFGFYLSKNTKKLIKIVYLCVKLIFFFLKHTHDFTHLKDTKILVISNG